MTVLTTGAAHPLDMITADEIRRAAGIVRADARYEPDAVFVHLRLREPDKATLSATGLSTTGLSTTGLSTTAGTAAASDRA